MKFSYAAYALIFALPLWCCGGAHEQLPRTKALSSDKLLLQEMNRYTSEKEQDILSGYVRRQGLSNMKQSAQGYFYEVVEEGKGAALKEGDIATLCGRIFLLDGTPCYTYSERHPLSVKLGMHADVKILNVALRSIKRQSHVRFIFPAYQAYGLLGDGDKIPAKSAIVCDFTVK